MFNSRSNYGFQFDRAKFRIYIKSNNNNNYNIYDIYIVKYGSNIYTYYILDCYGFERTWVSSRDRKMKLI